MSTNLHDGHRILYYEEQVIYREVDGVLPDGNIDLHYKEFVDEVKDIYLFCDTCRKKINGTEIGALADGLWKAEVLGL